MMPDLAAIYDAKFFAEWGPQHPEYVETAAVIVDRVLAEFQPKRLVDLGCGCVVYAHGFARKGVEVVAIDGVKPPPEHSFPAAIELRDLTEPFENQWGEFDLTLCLEVAEHIPEEMSDAFLDNLVRFSDTVVLSAAPPGQGGHHHVNERPKRYWVRRMAERGFAYERKRSGRLFEAVNKIRPPYMWMAQHAAVYERVPEGELPRILPFNVPI